VLLLRDVEGLSGEEAAALDLEVGAMKSRLHRARLELKARVEALLGHPVQEVIP
jgi:RNA polymerase sigma-70 factor (ECF subfamily)